MPLFYQPTTVSLIRNETPGGSINGSNVNFTTAAVFATGSLKVYLNGQRLTAGTGVDYVEVTQGFTMQYAPLTGDVLLVDYETNNAAFIQGSNSIVVQETPSGTVNGSNTVFTTLLNKYVANTLEVFLNGLQQTRGTDYTETTPGSGTFTFTTAPLTGDAVRVAYQFSTGASGNADTVDGFHASSTATANTLYPLNSNAAFPVSIIDQGSGGAWLSWTPTWTGITIGNATVLAQYIQIGKTVVFEIIVTTGTTTSMAVSADTTFTLPVTKKNVSQYGNVGGSATYLHGGGNNYSCTIISNTNSTTSAILTVNFVSGSNILTKAFDTAQVPAFSTGDTIQINGFYQAA